MSPRLANRDPGVDALRGLAIVAMVAAHLARDVLSLPHPLWLRAFGSVAAPLFVTLSGLLIAQTMAAKHYPLGHYLNRGGLILVLAAFVDMLLWGQYPFVTCDVLYLIGLALPLTMLFARLRPASQMIGLSLFLVVSAILQNLLGYPAEVTAVALSEPPAEWLAIWPQSVHQFLLSGWFPLFPWLFFSGLGVLIYQWRKMSDRESSYLLQGGVWLLGLGLLSAVLFPVAPLVRKGYSELFYPPSLAFVLLAAASVLFLFYAFRWKWLSHNRPLILLGKCPLLLYVVHLLFIHWVLMPVYPAASMPLYGALYALVIVILVGLASVVEVFKRRSTGPLPLVVRLLVGA
jgi:uncharacterized membrane protein